MGVTAKTVSEYSQNCKFSHRKDKTANYAITVDVSLQFMSLGLRSLKKSHQLLF